MSKAIAIYPDKTLAEVEVNHYKEGQAIVGGLIQPVTLLDGSTMYVNEEFLYCYGPDDFNSIARDLAGLNGRPDLLMGGILGPVYVTGPLDSAGDDTDVTDHVRNQINRIASEAGAEWKVAR